MVTPFQEQPALSTLMEMSVEKGDSDFLAIPSLLPSVKLLAVWEGALMSYPPAKGHERAAVPSSQRLCPNLRSSEIKKNRPLEWLLVSSIGT